MLSETYDTKEKVTKIQICENGIPIEGEWNDFWTMDSAQKHIRGGLWMNLGSDYTIEVTKTYKSIYVIDTII